MKNFIFALIVVALGVSNVISIRSCSSERRDKEQAEKFIERMAQGGIAAPLAPVDTVRDSVNGVNLNVYKPTVHNGENVADSYAISPGFVDSLQMALDKSVSSGKAKDREILSLSKMNVALQAQLQGTYSRDTLGRLWATAKDDVFNVRFNVDSGRFDIGANIPLAFADYTVGSGWFKRKKLYTATYSPDNRIQFNNVYTVRRNPDFKRSMWGLGATFGPTVTPEGFNYLGVTVGLQYLIKEF
jgi:hypothetical protein